MQTQLHSKLFVIWNSGHYHLGRTSPQAVNARDVSQTQVSEKSSETEHLSAKNEVICAVVRQHY